MLLVECGKYIHIFNMYDFGCTYVMCIWLYICDVLWLYICDVLWLYICDVLWLYICDVHLAVHM